MENIQDYLVDISLMTYIIVLAAGILTSFTPCIYQLIPILTGVIGASKERSKLKNFYLSITYVAGMAVTFSGLGITAALTGRLFGQIQTSYVAHLIVGNILIFFALALLNIISLPVFLLNRIGAGKVIKGG